MRGNWDREDLERVPRIYKTNKEVAAAMGMHMNHFSRLCRKHKVETPAAKRRHDGSGRRKEA